MTQHVLSDVIDCFILLDIKMAGSFENASKAQSKVLSIAEIAWITVKSSTLEILHQESSRISTCSRNGPANQSGADISPPIHDDLDASSQLRHVLSRLDCHLDDLIQKGHSTCFVSFGGSMLRTILPAEARLHSLDLPTHLTSPRLVDVRLAAAEQLANQPEIPWGQAATLEELALQLGLEPEPQNACEMLLRILRRLGGEDSGKVTPVDLAAEWDKFTSDSSMVVRMTGLPQDLSHTELEAWFKSGAGVKPAAFWMVRTQDNQRPSGSGFVVFATHADALLGLAMDGRTLNDRLVELAPSGQFALDAAGSTLAPFPMGQKNKYRPGDWVCGGCQFHNFAARRTCLRCNSPAHGGPATSNFAPGDWVCPNPACYFHNYASRPQCLRCNTVRPNGGIYPLGYRPGDWRCPNHMCQFQNFASRTACLRCGTVGGQHMQHASVTADVFVPMNGTVCGWLCRGCGTHNFSHQCVRCSSFPFSQAPSSPPSFNFHAPPPSAGVASPPPPPPPQLHHPHPHAPHPPVFGYAVHPGNSGSEIGVNGVMEAHPYPLIFTHPAPVAIASPPPVSPPASVTKGEWNGPAVPEQTTVNGSVAVHY
ncbi:uncharacterized protein VTP21DRAFT_2802 [Calcarisporiella thermophila]|uniref:uncharacterized protein n=1 Tax=Calcarisporiella thermophila TaxID=911321 RepID=UPI003742CB62